MVIRQRRVYAVGTTFSSCYSSCMGTITASTYQASITARYSPCYDFTQ